MSEEQKTVEQVKLEKGRDYLHEEVAYIEENGVTVDEVNDFVESLSDETAMPTLGEAVKLIKEQRSNEGNKSDEGSDDESEKSDATGAED